MALIYGSDSLALVAYIGGHQIGLCRLAGFQLWHPKINCVGEKCDTVDDDFGHGSHGGWQWL